MTLLYRRIITGAAGSGKSTLAAALAARIGAVHVEGDDFGWEPTDPPFLTRRDPIEAQAAVRRTLAELPRWVLVGQLTRWGDSLMPLFDLVVFLYVPLEARLQRLERREREAYGPKIDPGGIQHESYQEFMRLARGYETGEAPVNTLANARAWLSRLPCPVIEIAGEPSIEESLAAVLNG